MACCRKVHVCMQTFPNSHIFLQLSADVLRRMRESEQPGNTKSPSSLSDNQKDPSSELQAESLPVLQRSIWQPLCKCFFHCSYKKTLTASMKYNTLFSVLATLSGCEMLYLLILFIFTSFFFRCKTNRTLTDRSTGRNPQKVSAHNIEVCNACCCFYLNELLTLCRNLFVIRIGKK